MKKWMRNLPVVLVVILLMSMLAGCGRKELDAAKAVDAYLRAELKGEFDDYAEMVGEDKENLQKEYDEMIDEAMQIFEEIEFLDVDFGDDFAAEVKNLLASAKYEVIGSQKDDNGDYVVDVEVSPSDVFVVFFGKVMDAAKQTEDMDAVGAAVLTALQEAIAEQTYGDPVSGQIHITYDEDEKQYEINEDDVQKLSENFFTTDGLLDQLYTPSGTVYDDPYLNWTGDDWNAASEDEKTQCCLSLIREIQGATEEEMAAIDLNDPTAQQMIQQLKDGVNLSFSSGINISMGDYAELIKNEM
ncbi:MAG: DUF5105 domain-containing protein [Lachnospiraceae bacterium]